MLFLMSCSVGLQGVGALQEVQLPIIDSKTCQDMYLINPTENIDIRDDMMCAGFQQGGKDSCQVRRASLEENQIKIQVNEPYRF